MLRLVFLLVLGLFCFSVNVKAQLQKFEFGKIDKKDLEMSIYPLDSSADAVYLVNYGNVNFNEGDLSMYIIHHVRIKILSKSGFDKADIELNYIKGVGNIQKLKAATYNLKDGKIVASSISKKAWVSEKYNDMLTDQTKIFLKLKPLKKIPHSFIKNLVEPMILRLDKTNNVEIVIVGSYRRKTNYSSDVDAMVISDNKNALSAIVSSLKFRKDTKVYPYIVGSDKISLILKIRGKTIKLDFFRTPKKEKWAMLLYSTGSKHTNIKMRNKAKQMGMLLNQKGLYKNGKLLSIPSKTKSEKFFFKKLNMPYVTPQKR